MFKRKYRPQTDPKTWDLHPCTTPDDKDMSYAEIQAILGNVWRCQCGRRWRLVEVAIVMDDEDDPKTVYRYEEVVAGGLDAELKQFFSEEIP